MLAHELLRRAAAIVEEGWSEGPNHARDADGRPVELYSRAAGGSSRAGINPNAARFSAYGAVAKVLASAPAATGSSVLWTRLADAAKASMAGRTGGTNYVHPLVGFNASEGRTAAEVVALLLEVADELDPANAVVAGRAT